MTTLTELTARFDARRTTYLTQVGRAQALAEARNKLWDDARALSADAYTCEKVAALFQSYSEAEHEELRERIETLVTYGLQAVFGMDMTFRVVPGQERGQATMRFAVESTMNGTEVVTDVLDARGGGVASIIGFILRTVVLALSPNATRRFLVLDETFGMVSAEYIEPLSDLLRKLVDETGVQMLVVTHEPRLGMKADKLYRFTHNGERTIVNEIEAADL